MVVEDNPWILGSLTITSRMGSLSASIATNTDTWQKNVDQTRKNEKQEHVSNATRKGTLPKDCKRKQVMKERRVQEESDDEDKEEEKSFGEDLK